MQHHTLSPYGGTTTHNVGGTNDLLRGAKVGILLDRRGSVSLDEAPFSSFSSISKDFGFQGADYGSSPFLIRGANCGATSLDKEQARCSEELGEE